MKHTLLSLGLMLNLALSSQNLQTVVFESWTNNAWQNSVKENYVYNGSALTSLTQQNWQSASSSWQNSSLVSYTNNASGLATVTLFQSWNAATSTWTNLQRITSTYTTANNPLTDITEMWISGAWQNAGKLTRAYDASNFLINQVQQNWNASSSAWINASQRNYINNTNGTAQQYILQAWNSSNTWDNASRTTYTYNAASKPVTILTENWVSSAWQNVNNATNTYNTSGYETLDFQQTWNNSTSAWQNTFQAMYTNNMNGTVDTFLSQTWNATSSSWTNSQRLTYTYAAITTGIAEQNAGPGIVPAPVYYDLQGRVMEKAFNQVMIEQQGNSRKKVIIQN